MCSQCDGSYCCLGVEPHHVGCFGQQPYFPEVHKRGKDDVLVGCFFKAISVKLEQKLLKHETFQEPNG